jgi:hypothetical protein
MVGCARSLYVRLCFATVVVSAPRTCAGPAMARLHCRFALPLTHFVPDSLIESAPPFLKRQATGQ